MSVTLHVCITVPARRRRKVSSRQSRLYRAAEAGVPMTSIWFPSNACRRAAKAAQSRSARQGVVLCLAGCPKPMPGM